VENIKRSWFQTLRVKLIAIIITTASVVLIALALTSYNYIKSNKLNELSALAEVSASRISSHLVIPMWTLDREQVNDLVQVEMQEKRLAAIVIRDEDQRTLFLAKEREYGGEIVDSVAAIAGDFFTVSRAIVKDDKSIGTVSVFVSKQSTYNELLQLGRGALIAFIILNIVIFIIMMFSINRLILVPLEQLTSVAIRISNGDIDRAIQVGSNDEIGDLAVAFQKMQISLKIILRRLAKRNRSNS